jgi:hypothetical protein
MSRRKVYFVICMLISTVCLAAGYASAGQWMGAGLAIILIAAWWLARKYPDADLGFICLLSSVCLAVAGQLSGAMAVLMTCGAGAALAAWDLLELDESLKGDEPQTREYESRHLQALALALGSGLLLAILGRLLNFQMPFIVVALSVGVLLFGLDRVWLHIKKRGMDI